MVKRNRLPPTRTRDSSDDASGLESESLSSSQRDLKKVRWESNSHTGDLNASGETEKESEVVEKTCLAIFCLHRRVGCAYYDTEVRKLCVLEDTQESPHFDMTRMLLEQVDPDIVLTSSKSDEDFKNMLDNYVENKSGFFQIRPFKEFTASKGRERLLSLCRLLYLTPDEDVLPPSSDVDSNYSPSRRRNAYNPAQSRSELLGDPTARRWTCSIRLANFVSVDSSPICMGSIGALLDHVLRESALADSEDEGVLGLDIRDIEILSLNEVMQINSDALVSLQVFENESHASVHSDRTKEGLSLFGMLNSTRTALGRYLLKTWLLRPSTSLSVIKGRQDAVDCFCISENIVTANGMHNHLKGFGNIPRIVSRMRSGKGIISDWKNLVKFTFHATMLREAVSELHQANDVEIVKKLIKSLDLATFKEIGIMINDIIDWEESVSNGRVCVRPNIDKDLDNQKHVYHGIDSVLSAVAQRISRSVPLDFAKSLNVVYFPQLGFLICVPMLEEWRMEANVQPLEGWTFQFSSEDHVYFKSSEMHDMDVHIGDLYSSIVDRELEIVQELLEEVLKRDEAISTACDVGAELDCLLSFSEASRVHNLQRPEITEDNVIEIIQGRHPLYEQVVDTFVPNDAHLLGGAGIGAQIEYPDDVHQWNSILLCTGANACGKSVYLKQVAIIQIMAQVGCFVPAESATLGIVDKIFTRVSTRESVTKAQSAFMIDLAQVSLALRNCTARSLILLDEFGKGTLSTDGAGLFCGVLRHLLNRGSGCPKVLVATHFHDVFDDDIFDPSTVPVSFYHMQVMFTSTTGEIMDTKPSTPISSISSPTDPENGTRSIARHPEKITYLYRVAEGLCFDSNAAKCAEIFGLPVRIVERAQYVTQLISQYEVARLLDEGMTEKERQELEEAEAVCRRFLAWDLQADEEDDLATGETKKKLEAVLGKDNDVQ